MTDPAMNDWDEVRLWLPDDDPEHGFVAGPDTEHLGDVLRLRHYWGGLAAHHREDGR